MKKKIIEFNDFNFRYRVQQDPTLKNINLTIYEGEKVLILGPSGSGKSTLAHCINGLVPFFYEGEVTGTLKIKEEDAKNKNIFEISKVVGTVLQDPDSQFIGLTVGEDIAFKLENYCVSQEEMIKKVNKASKLVDIQNELYASPYNLSGGQKQRVTLAGVIVDDVDVLLFDEPLASLDPKTGKSAMKLIDDIQKNENKTIIIIEHRLEDVLECDIDRIIVMKDGEIVKDTTPSELLSSNILEEVGVRPPLYITSLKHANCSINSNDNLENIEKLNIDSYKDNLVNWSNNITIEHDNVEKEDKVLELKDVSFSYNEEKQILKNVSFDINKGDMISIVGKNGAGKSTISKVICGFYKPTSGNIILDNEDITKSTIKERSENIGFVMQNPNQMISKSIVFEEVAFGLEVKGLSDEEVTSKVNDVLKVCGLYKMRNWPISALSFGQKKRVTIASILVLNPKILILDEPTAGQDYKHYTEIMEFLVQLNKSGITIIMITHDMHLMLEYTNRTIVLSDGCKVSDDNSIDVILNQDILEKANLKETSLYSLAKKCDMNNPKEFVNKFIKYDREVR